MKIKYRFNPKILRVLVLLSTIFLIVYFLLQVKIILPPFFLAIVLAYLLNPFVSSLEKKEIPRSISILLVYLTMFTLFGLVIIYAFPVIYSEVNLFIETIPHYTQEVQGLIKQFNERYERVYIPESLRQVINETINSIELGLIAYLDSIAERLLGWFSGLITIFITPILAFYMLKDNKNICSRIMNIFPCAWQKEIVYLWKETDRILMKFVRGHLLVACIVGILTAIGLTLIGLKFAIILGIIAGIFDLIPYFGPIIGVLPALIVAFIDTEVKVIQVILIMVLIQQLESNLISPKILGESVGLHPLTVIFVVLAGGHLFGLLGLVLAVPITAIARIVTNYWVDKITG
ncbi:MAG: AI-2E family transporter [Bacillota bacterium]